MCPPGQLKVLTALAVALTPASGKATQQHAEGASDSGVLTLAPRYALDLGSETLIRGLVFSNDGTSLFAETRCPAVNVWAIVVHYWPELAALAVFLVSFGVGLKAFRAMLRHQFPGKLHCSVCNYCLEGSLAGRCPECGCDLSARPPILGRTTWRRTRLYAGATTFLWAACLSLILWGPVRDNPASTWFEWWSPKLFELAEQRNWSYIANSATKVNRIVAINVRTGEVDRTLLGWSRRRLLPLALVSDGAALITDCAAQRELVVISEASGRVLRTISYAEDIGGKATGPPSVFGFSSDRQAAFVRQEQGARRCTQVTEVALATGEQTVLFETDSRSRAEHDPRLRVIPGAARKILEIGGAVGRPGLSKQQVLVHSAASAYQPLELLQIPASVRFNPVVFSDDGQRMFVRCSGPPAGILTWDLATGAQGPTLGTPEGRRPLWTPKYDDDYDRLFVVLRPRSRDCAKIRIGVADLRERTWLAELEYPADAHPGQPHRLCVSPDGKTLATACMKRGKTSKAVGHKLLLWDLSVLEASRERREEPSNVHSGWHGPREARP